MKAIDRAHHLLTLCLPIFLLPTAVGTAQVQPSPYAGLEQRSVKALSPEQIASYAEGRGMALALAAELNGYPGPMHVLELQEALELTATQRQSTEAVFDEMKAAAVSIGQQIVVMEEELDRMFSSHTIDAESLATQVTGIAELQGRLRVIHLQAHLRMMDVLSEEQIRRYAMQRGYRGSHDRHH